MNHGEDLSRESIEKLSLTELIDIMKKYSIPPQRTQLKCVDALLSYAERETRRERRQLNKTSTISASNEDVDTSALSQCTFPAQTPDTSWQHAF